MWGGKKWKENIIRMDFTPSPWNLYKWVSETGQSDLMKLAVVTLEIRSPDSWLGNSILSPASGWLVNKLAPPILRSWGEFLKRIAGWHPAKSPDGLLPGGPQRPEKGTRCAGKAILCEAASPGGHQVLYVKSGSHRGVKHEPIYPSFTPWGKNSVPQVPWG